jgi:inhibitor of cysteine peptidase
LHLKWIKIKSHILYGRPGGKMYNKHFVNFLVALLVLLIPACSSGEEDQPSSEPSAVVEGNLQVDRIDLVILESFPVQVRATLIGNLLDGCTTVGGTNISYADNQFMIEVTTTRPADAVCTEALVPFEQTVALDVLDLPAGDYTVVAGNAISVFNLAVDNKIQVPAETEERAPVANRIQGLVWHDVCAVAGGVNAEPAVPSEGCLQMEDGGFQANGVLTPDEPGIEGVEVVLRAVTCEGELLGSTLTDGDGRFAFENLDVGGYCVAVDPLENPNSGILIPGSWTSDLQGNAIVNLTTGQVVPDVNFGWDNS